MRYLFSITVLLLLSLMAYAETKPELRFEQANAAYREGDFKQAASIYLQIVESGYVSAALYYNLGNSYYRQGKVPHAILYYERARKLAPRDEAITHNLELARQHVADKIEAVPSLFFVRWWQHFTRLMHVHYWAWLTIGCVWLFFAAALLFVYHQQLVFRKAGFYVAWIAFFAAGISGTCTWQQHRYVTGNHEAIIFEPTIHVKSAPGPDRTNRFVLHEGTKVLIDNRLDGWVQIRLADGKKGWLPSEALRVI